MHRTIYNEFRTIVAGKNPSGRCLEVGALPGAESLLTMDCISHMERIGVNLYAGRHSDFEILQANANDMRIFPKECFDLVLCNAMLEHDRFFWLTAGEIRRVLKVGGLAVIGAPGFAPMADVKELGIAAPWPSDAMQSWIDCSLTFVHHSFPDDYYRFSESAFRAVLLSGYEDVHVRVVMIPPRIIGYGTKGAG